MRLILVEDNTRLAGFIAKGLHTAGFTVDAVTTGGDAQTALSNDSYDAMILDLGLPDMDGLDLVRMIRSAGNSIPILILTARDDIGDRVKGLDIGADDYVVKPFAIAEIAARIRALLRRPSHAVDNILSYANLVLDTSNLELGIGGQHVALTRRETNLLHQLLRRAGHVVTRASLETKMYGHDDEMTPNSLEVTVSRLRKSLAASAADVEIKTLRNIGYMLIATTA